MPARLNAALAFMIARLTWLLLLVLALDVHAACGGGNVILAGRVITADGSAVSDALLTLTWEVRGKLEDPYFSSVDPNGDFKVRIPFDSYSGRKLLGGDICNGRLNYVRMCVSAPRFLERCVSVTASDFGASQNIVLDLIQLRGLKHSIA